MSTLPRLSERTLDLVPPSVSRPAYDRARLRTGIVHLGVGAFHRAHWAVYTEAALEAGDAPWGTLGASLRSPDTRDALGPQDGLYALAVRDAAGERLRVVGSVARLLVAPEDPEALLAAMSGPDARIVSLTVTEKGYCHRPATGELDEAHPDVLHDLAHPEAPRSAPGLIVEAPRRRPALLHGALLRQPSPQRGDAEARARALRRPVRARARPRRRRGIALPLDHGGPHRAGHDRRRARGGLGRAGAAQRLAGRERALLPVGGQDDFGLGRPEWDRAGAMFVTDVAPFELAKLRLLNGSHSTLAYLGYLAGHETVADTMGAPGFAALLRGLMLEEVAPTLPPVPGLDLAGYADQLVERFRNPALCHRTWQIATDGTQKLPQRLLGTARDRLAAGAPIDRLALGVAAWMRYAVGVDERSQPIDLRDPLAHELRCRTAGVAAAGPLAEALFALDAVFGDDLPREPRFTGAVEAALDKLICEGARATVARFGIPARRTAGRPCAPGRTAPRRRRAENP